MCTSYDMHLLCKNFKINYSYGNARTNFDLHWFIVISVFCHKI